MQARLGNVFEFSLKETEVSCDAVRLSEMLQTTNIPESLSVERDPCRAVRGISAVSVVVASAKAT